LDYRALISLEISFLNEQIRVGLLKGTKVKSKGGGPKGRLLARIKKNQK